MRPAKPSEAGKFTRCRASPWIEHDPGWGTVIYHIRKQCQPGRKHFSSLEHGIGFRKFPPYPQVKIVYAVYSVSIIILQPRRLWKKRIPPHRPPPSDPSPTRVLICRENEKNALRVHGVAECPYCPALGREKFPIGLH
jgi:hypothetical protein